MANNIQHELDAIEIEGRQVHDAVRVVLHTILFSRSLGEVSPRELSPASFPGISYATCGDPQVDLSVEQAIEQFCDNLTLIGPDLVRGELQVSFYDTKKRSGFLGIGGAREERVYWERWLIPMIISTNTNEKDKQSDGDVTENAIRSNLFRVLNLCNDLAHVPALRTEESGAKTFKYEITVTPRARSKDGGRTQEFIASIFPKGVPSGSMRFNL